MMCESCTEGTHWLCGMQTWCECDCDGPDGLYLPDFDPLDPTTWALYGYMPGQAEAETLTEAQKED